MMWGGGLLLFTELMLFNEEANEVIVYVLAWIIVINIY